MRMFFRACRHHSTKSAKLGGGEFDTVCPLVCKIHPRRPCVSGGCASRVKFSAGIRQGYLVAPCVPPETEADPVQRLFCQLNLAFDGLLVMFRL